MRHFDGFIESTEETLLWVVSAVLRLEQRQLLRTDFLDPLVPHVLDERQEHEKPPAHRELLALLEERPYILSTAQRQASQHCHYILGDFAVLPLSLEF